ncbi:MAG: 1,4-dihydroxy-2-naphthoate octaprenyltransferase [Desulfobacteraceae bacterium]|nr:MAG: 1,4-dihydroxy-2-naphthoate octaprenyltransferase [Desulfobacteraceae bacterium]
MHVYLRALRAPFLAGSIMPVIIGAVYAFSQGLFSWPLFLIALLGVAALHLGANLINDYYDAKGSDPLNLRLTPFSGGSRVIQNQEIKADTILVMALVCFAIGLCSGAWLTFSGRPWVAVIGLLGLLAGWTYSSPPLQLMSRGWGEIVIFFAFGPLVTLGAYYVFSAQLSLPAFLLGIPQGFLIAGVIWINEFPDYEADRQAGKNNLVVQWGPQRARYGYILIISAAFITLPILAVVPHLSVWVLLPFVALPLAVKGMKILWREYLSHEGVVPAQALNIQTLAAHGLLLSAGLFLSRWFAGVA